MLSIVGRPALRRLLLVFNRREDKKNKRDSKPSITTTPHHDHHHLHDQDAEFALMIRALNEGRSPYERRTIARTFVGRLAAATWAPRAGEF